jgi:hypothetical protein
MASGCLSHKRVEGLLVFSAHLVTAGALPILHELIQITQGPPAHLTASYQEARTRDTH